LPPDFPCKPWIVPVRQNELPLTVRYDTNWTRVNFRKAGNEVTRKI
jgi:hypothetical protein